MTLIVNGTDLAPYVAYGGIQWQRSDVDGPNATRSIDDAYLTRNRIAIKYRIDVTCRPLTLSECSIVLSAIKPEYVTVQYTDPEAGGDVTRTMYSNNIPAQFLMKTRDGRELWGGITFPLVQR